MEEAPEWDLQPGEVTFRGELHDRFGGNRQRGISPSRKSPNILLFSDPAAGQKHGYRDDLSSDPISYFGEGQSGDQEITHGNRAILRHREDGRALRMFEVQGTEARYLGEVEVDPGQPYFWAYTTQTDREGDRNALVFRLRRMNPLQWAGEQ